MKKLILGGIAVSLALSLAPAHADPVHCETLPAYDSQGEVCTYTAAGPGKYVVISPNHWSVEVFRTINAIEQKVFEVGGSSLTPPTNGDLPTLAGDRVVVTQGRDCVPPLGPCGTGGIVAAGEAHP